MKSTRGPKAAGQTANRTRKSSLSSAVLRTSASRERSVARLEAVASLSRGLSHELGNVLTIALGNVSLVRTQLEDPELRAMLDDAVASIDEAVRISEKLAAIGNQDLYSPRLVDLSAFVASYVASARRRAGDAITIVVRSKGRFGPVLIDPRYLEQALDALLKDFPENKAFPATVRIELGPETSSGTATGACAAVSICIHDSRDRPRQQAKAQRPGALDSTVNDCPWPDIGTWFARQFAMACGGRFSTMMGKSAKPWVCITLPCL